MRRDTGPKRSCTILFVHLSALESAILASKPSRRFVVCPGRKKEFERYRDHDVYQMSSELSLIDPNLFSVDVSSFIAKHGLRSLNNHRLLVVIVGTGPLTDRDIGSAGITQSDILMRRLRAGQQITGTPILFLGSSECIPDLSSHVVPYRGYWLRCNLEALLTNSDFLQDQGVFYFDVITPDSLDCHVDRFTEGSPPDITEDDYFFEQSFSLLRAAVMKTLSHI